jgi:hypothetical protein
MTAKNVTKLGAVPKAKKVAKAAAENPYAAAAALVAESSSIFEIDFSQVTRLGGGDGAGGAGRGVAANGSNEDPVVYTGQAELGLRRLVAHFAFPRLPLTWAELNGFMEYCENLWVAAGGGQDPKYHKSAQKAARSVDVRRQPWRVPAFDLYVAGDTAGLLALHTRDRTLERVAREWVEFPYPEGHPLFHLN